MIELDKDNLDELTKGEGVKVVKFWAPWCGVCKMIAPRFEALEKDYPEYTFISVNADKNPKAVETLKVTNLPYFAIYYNGELKLTGNMDILGRLWEFCITHTVAK